MPMDIYIYIYAIGGKKQSKGKGKPQKESGKGEIVCWTCGGRGHQSSVCPSKTKKVTVVANPNQWPDGSEKRVETFDAFSIEQTHTYAAADAPGLKSSLLADSGSETHVCPPSLEAASSAGPL
eukprot:4202488-Amphidinium_carterae.1